MVVFSSVLGHRAHGGLAGGLSIFPRPARGATRGGTIEAMRPVCEQAARDTVADLGLTEHLTPRRLAVANQLRGGERLADCWIKLPTAFADDHRFPAQQQRCTPLLPRYPQPYFATFWLDPWGLMLEAACHQDRD